MQALELHAEIDAQHQIHLQLPDTVKAKTAKIIVMYDELPESSEAPKRVFGQFRGKIHMADDFNAELPAAPDEETIVRRLKARFAHLPSGTSMADELIAERRQETSADEGSP